MANTTANEGLHYGDSDEDKDSRDGNENNVRRFTPFGCNSYKCSNKEFPIKDRLESYVH